MTVKLDGGFTLSIDSIFIGNIAAFDTGHFNFQITAPNVDTFTVCKVELNISNGKGDLDSKLLKTVHICYQAYYEDKDIDGFGNINSRQFACSAPFGFVADSSDCNDTLFSAHPGAAELCNGIDDNCNGQIDEGVKLTFYHDNDGDGFGNSSDSIKACTRPLDYVLSSADCNDTLASVHSGAAEVCNGIDDNCNGVIDEGVKIKFYRDYDGDGFGNIAITQIACFAPAGYVSDSTDCNDSRADAHSGQPELCNSMDDNCNGHIDEGCGGTVYFEDFDTDGFGNANRTITVNAASPQGYVTNNNDCDDTDINIHPGVNEICNGKDDNCNGTTDEGVQLTFYRDQDGDGFGLLSNTILACTPPAGYVTNSTDCNDNNAAIKPTALEIVCNGIDDNCNNQIDEGINPIFYADADGDGFGNAAITTHACTSPLGFVTDSTDCNDNNSSIKPGMSETCNGIDDNCNVTIDEGVLTTFFQDSDGDGFGNPAATTNACTAPLGFTLDSADCNDGNASIHPGISEICNSIDDNCNTTIDEGVQITYFEDTDVDGFGSDAATTQACSQPSGFVLNNLDCDDGNSNIHPGVTELCNGLDDDCNGQIDENVKLTFYLDSDGDGFGNSILTTLACSVPAGYVINNTDCNDSLSSVHPLALEVCNSIDDNCNNQTDEGVLTTFYRDFDGDGFGNAALTRLACSVPAGYSSNNTDCDDGHASTYPGTIDVCNGIDDNCNGTIDEGVKTIFYRDADNDGYGNVNSTFLACIAPPGYLSDSTDCNDNNAAVHPGVIELSNGIDDNCNGIVDEGFPSTSVNLHLKVFIGGYYLGNGLMQAAIDPVNLASICDTLTAELHDAVYPFSLAYADTKTININGTGDFNFPISAMGQSYYLVVRHRNAIESWSANPITIGYVTFYDFTTATSKVFGNNMAMTSDSMGWAIYSGDISDAVLGVGHQDGVIESQDYSDMENAVAVVLQGYVPQDITGDGVVESLDYSIMENNVYYVVFVMRP